MKKFILRCVILGVSTGMIMFLLSRLPVFEPMDEQILDKGFLLRGERTPESDVTIVRVGKEYRDNLARKSYAKLVDQCYRTGAKVGFDLVLNQPNEVEDPKLVAISKLADVYYVFAKMRTDMTRYGPEELRKRVTPLKEESKWAWEMVPKGQGNLVLLEKELIIAPLPELSRAVKGRIGHAHTETRPKRMLHQFPLLIEYDNHVYPALGLEMACDYLKVDRAKTKVCLGKHIELHSKTHGRIRIPIDGKGRMYINYVGAFEKFDNFSLKTVLAAEIQTLSGFVLVGAERVNRVGLDNEVSVDHKWLK